jgi:hypothetical protein
LNFEHFPKTEVLGKPLLDGFSVSVTKFPCRQTKRQPNARLKAKPPVPHVGPMAHMGPKHLSPEFLLFIKKDNFVHFLHS